MSIRTPASNLVRDEEQVKKGGSNDLQFGVTDAEADAIWGGRYSHSINDITTSVIKIDNFYEADFLVGASWRVRGSSSNDGLFTIDTGTTIDPSGGNSSGPVTLVEVEETLTSETPSDAVLEPVQLAGGWHRISHLLQGGTITHDRDVERIMDETDSEVAEVVNSDEYTIARTVLPNSEWFKLALDWLEDNFVPVRDSLPLTTKGDYFEGNSGEIYKEFRFYPHVSAQKESYEESVGADEQRDHEITLNASKAPDSNPDSGKIVVPEHGAVVLPDGDQSGWDSAYDQFKDDNFTTTRTTS